MENDSEVNLSSMLSLIELIKGRDMLFTELTLNIIKSFQDKLDKAFSFYLKKDRKIYWYAIERLAEVDDYVYLAGLLEPKEGDVLLTDNSGKVLVDMDYVKSNRKSLIKVILNIKTLENGNSEEIYNEIKLFCEKSKTMTDEQIIKDLAKSATPVPPSPVVTPTINNPDWDLKNFSEEQIKQIKYFSNNITKN